MRWNVAALCIGVVGGGRRKRRQRRGKEVFNITLKDMLLC